MTLDPALVERIGVWRQKPHVMVRELFGATPDLWQDEALKTFPHNPRLALKASKGPGKTCLVSWLSWNFMLCYDHANIAALSISADNLRDGLWKEMAVWLNKAPLLQHFFQWGVERIIAKQHPATWFMSARSWAKTSNAEELGNVLAGLHSDNVMMVMDESGSIPVPILMSAEGVLANCINGKVGHIVQAGNTNTLDGSLYYACVKQAHLWKVIVISGDPDDPNRSPRISMEWAKELIRTLGRDDPFVKVAVLGEWPPSSVNALIGPDEVESAMRRSYREYEYNKASKIMGVDVAREGDDKSVIFKRQGIIAFPPRSFRNADSLQGAGAVAREWNEWDADACFVDNTGGFGAGWIDQLRVLGKAPIGVQYSGKAHRSELYVNKRTEMYFDAVAWIKEGGQLPPVPELTAALTQTNYTHKGDRLILEPKEIIKAKIGYSPDDSDAFVQTFAEPVSPKNMRREFGVNQNICRNVDYDAFSQYFENSK